MARAPTSDKPAADSGAPKKVNGLTKPMTLSPALATIVGAKKDEKLARSEIVKRLWAYLKAKNLQVTLKLHILDQWYRMGLYCNSTSWL